MKPYILPIFLCLSAFGQSVNYAPATVPMANAGTTGTTVAKLVKCTGAPCTAVIATTSDTSGVLGVAVSGAGTTGNVLFAPTHGPGIVSLAMDGATTAGDLVVPSTTAGGSGHDSGVAANGTCPSSQVIGVVLSTNGGSGTYQVSLGGTCVNGGLTDFTTGTSKTFSLNSGYFECTGTCTITMPVPAAGQQFCIRNANNVATVITFAAIGSSARYENTASTAYGTAGTGTLVSGGAIGDRICLVGKDSTHYDIFSFNGTWTAN